VRSRIRPSSAWAAFAARPRSRSPAVALLQTVHHVRDLRARSCERALEVRLHRRERLLARAAQRGEARLVGGAHALALGAHAQRLEPLRLELLAQLREPPRERFEARVLAVHQLARALDERLRQSHALRRPHRAARARLTLVDLEGGQKRCEVELGTRVQETAVAPGQLLQPVEVSGRQHEGGLLDQRLEYGLRERGAFAGLRTLADLVGDHERARVGQKDDRRQVRHARGEGREARAQILLVADVREYGVEDRHAAARVAGDVQPRANREHGQADRLCRHGLAAGVRTRDHQTARAGDEREVVRHDVFGLEPGLEQQQRMAQPAQIEIALDGDVGRDAE
jgi:hypothetical protein